MDGTDDVVESAGLGVSAGVIVGKALMKGMGNPATDAEGVGDTMEGIRVAGENSADDGV